MVIYQNDHYLTDGDLGKLQQIGYFVLIRIAVYSYFYCTDSVAEQSGVVDRNLQWSTEPGGHGFDFHSRQ